MLKPTLARCAKAATASVVALIFAWAAWERFRLPLTPAADSDLRAYLGPGLLALLGRGFHEQFGQCFLYPGFLYVVLRISGDFRCIVVVQHLLGIGTGALLFGCWMQLRCLLPTPRLPMPVFKLLGALLISVYLFSIATIRFERSVRPEAIFPFFAVLSIYCNLCFIRDRFLVLRSRRALFSGGMVFFFSVVAWLLKPSFAPILIVGNLPLLISLFRAGQSARDKLIIVGVPAFAATVLLVWPEWTLRRENSTGALFLSQSLFSIHANLINDQMAEDLARHAATPYPTDFIATTHSALTDALRESRGEPVPYWPALGFNADYLRLGSAEKSPFMGWLFSRLGSDAERIEFCRYYYWRTFLHHPAWIGAKIARQMGVFYQFGYCPAYHVDRDGSLDKDYQQSADALVPYRKLLMYPPGAVLLARTEALASTTAQIGPYPGMVRVSNLLAASYLVWCLWAVLLGVVVWRSHGVRDTFSTVALALLLLYSYNFGTVLALAIGHSLDIGRYSQYQLAYTVLPEFGSIWLAAEAMALVASGPFIRSVARAWDRRASRVAPAASRPTEMRR